MPPYTKYEGTFFFWFYLKHPVSKLLRTGKGRSCFGCKEKRCRHTLCLANRFDEADGHKMPFVRRMFSYGSRPLSGFKLYDRAMYAAIAMFVSSKVVDFVLYGATTSKLCYIISDENERVREAIVTKLHRGVTMVKGIGAYSGMEKQVLLCVVKRQEAMELRRLVRESDEKAFLIITDAHDVYGKGFTNLDSKE